MFKAIIWTGLAVCLAATGIGAQEPADLIIRDKKIGQGKEAREGAIVSVHYVGVLTNGRVFDSSYYRKKPFSFRLGAGEVIRGWDLGVKGMRVGGVRELTIPSRLAYGERGAGQLIPPGSTLKFSIELLGVE